MPLATHTPVLIVGAGPIALALAGFRMSIIGSLDKVNHTEDDIRSALTRAMGHPFDFGAAHRGCLLCEGLF